MAIVTVKMFHDDYFREIALARFGDQPLADWVREHTEVYGTVAEWATHRRGEAAAEEVFDLSNNPARDEERRQLLGRTRCLSVGDIVEVTEANGVVQRFLCESVGWTEINA